MQTTEFAVGELKHMMERASRSATAAKACTCTSTCVAEDWGATVSDRTPTDRQAVRGVAHASVPGKGHVSFANRAAPGENRAAPDGSKACWLDDSGFAASVAVQGATSGGRFRCTRTAVRFKCVITATGPVYLCQRPAYCIRTLLS